MKLKTLTLTLALLLAACGTLEIGFEATATVPPTTAPTVVSTTAPTATPGSPADAVPYTNAEGSFSMLLPAGWNVAGPLAAQGFNFYALGPDAGSSGGPDVSQIIIADATQLTVEQFAQGQCSVCPAHPVEEATVGGLSAKRTTIGGGSAPEFEWYFVTHNGKLIGFSLRPRDGQSFDWVISTLKFEAANVGQTQTYRNTTIGFELDVPADWVIEETTPPSGPVVLDTVAYLYSRPPAPQPGGEGPFDGLKIDVVVMHDVSSKTLEQLVAEYKANVTSESNGQILAEQRQTLANGLEAVRLHTTSTFGEGAVLMAMVNGRALILGGSGTDLSRFDEVALTLRPIEGAAVNPLSFACSLAYADGSFLYCLGEGGTPIPIAEAGGQGVLNQPDLSFDGRWVAYSIVKADNTAELWAVEVSGLTGNDGLNLPRRKLVSAEQISNGDPSIINSPNSYRWQADLHVLYFNMRWTPAHGELGPGEYTHNDLWKVDVDSGLVTNLLSRNSAGQFYLSPDGQYVAISNPQSIAFSRADGTGFRLLVEFPAVNTYSEYQFKPELVWGPASDTFYAIVPSSDPFAADAYGTVYQMSVDGAATALGQLPGNFLFEGDIAPDGMHVVRVASDPAGARTSLHVVNSDGTGDLIVADLEGGSFSWLLGWSPDASMFAYARTFANGNYLVRADGVSQAFGEGLQAIEARWVSPNAFYFTGISDSGWGVYFQALGQPAAPLVTGPANPLSFDAR